MPEPLTLLTGANGRTGRAILAALHAAGAPTRALIRDERQAPDLLRLGAVACSLGDLEDEAAIDQAVAGCSTVIHVGPPMHPHEVEQTGRVLAAGQRHGIAHLVYYSVMHPLRREVRHHRLKLDAEEQVIESGVPYTILQPIRYMQHLEPIWPTVLREGIHALPYNVDIGFNVVDLADLAEATARVAGDPSYLYGTFELAGPESLSQTDMARILSEELGRPITARAVPLSELEANARQRGVPEERIAQMKIMNDHYDRFGFRGNPKILTWILGREPNDFRTYVRRLMREQNKQGG
jgi:uncharacterized protein YbjT (DUF2867 family)